MKEKIQVSKTGLKIISVVMALLLWFYVANQGELSTGTNLAEVKLDYYNIPADMNVSGPEKVMVKLWGSFNEAENIEAFVDLAGLKAGEQILSVNVKPVKGVMFTTVQPQKIKLTLENVSEKSLAINYEIVKQPPEGYKVLDILTVPERCLIKGEKAAVEKVSMVVSSIDLGNVKDITSLSLNLIPRDEKGERINEGIRIVPQSVEVYAVVEEIHKFKNLNVKAFIKGEADEGYRVKEVIVDPERVKAWGDEKRLALINEISTQEINFNERNESYSREIDLQIPASLNVYPSSINVTVIIEKIDDKEGER